ncbi:MAG: hypothetical protein AAGB01_03120 [Cyanobacteria bacterium P01_F01_bin.42]
MALLYSTHKLISIHNDGVKLMKLYIKEAFSLLGKTMPFIWLRLGTYGLFGLVMAIYCGLAFGVAWLLGQLIQILGILVFLAALAGAWGIFQWAARYFFYLLKAAHVAVMTEFIVYGEGPRKSQVAYGKKQVQDRFRDTSVMFAVDQLLDGVVRGFNRKFARVANLLPIPGLDNLTAFVEQVSKFATTYIDEAILSRAYQHREQNVWAIASDGVLLYAQAWKPILVNATALTLLSYVQFILLLVILAIPAILIGLVLPVLKTALGLIVIIGAFVLKLAIADAFSLASTLIAYHRSTETLEPDPAWQARLEQGSKKFVELRQRATEAMSNMGQRQNQDISPNAPQPIDYPTQPSTDVDS